MHQLTISTRITLPEPVQVTGENSKNYQPNTPELLGCLIQSSIDEDWAMISINHDTCVSILMNAQFRDISMPKKTRIAQQPKNLKGFLYNISTAERMNGTLSEDTTYMRLPGSFTSQELYMVTLDGVINWGDCGSVFLDAETQDLYGHAVASSENMGVAFLIPASRIFRSTRKGWNTALPSPTPEYNWSSGPSSAAATASLESIGVEENWRREPAEPYLEVPELFDRSGKWIPGAQPGYNIRESGGASGQWWLCDQSNKVQRLAGQNPPVGSSLYKTFSTIYSDGHGFHVLRGDATNSSAGESWHNL
jgi:hypothetical protein